MSPLGLFALVACAGVLLTALGFGVGFWDRLGASAEDDAEEFAAPENPFRPLGE